MYLYKINLVGGKSYIVKSNENIVKEFLETLFGYYGKQKTVTTFELAENIINEKFTATHVAIASDTVTSIEYQGREIK